MFGLFNSQTEAVEEEKEPPKTVESEKHIVEKYENQFQHQFRNEYGNEISYQFPAAMRSLAGKSGELESVYVQPVESELQPQHTAFKGTAKAGLPKSFREFFFKILRLEQHAYWEFLVFCSILTNCILTTYYFFFIQEEFTSLFPWIHVLDLIYSIDFALAAIATYTVFWRRFFKMKRRKNLEIVIDILSLMPLDLYYQLTIKNISSQVLICLHLPSYLRFYRVLLFFKSREGLAGAHRTTLSYVRYIILLAVSIHLFACLWYSAAHVPVKHWAESSWKKSFSNFTGHWEWYLVCSYYALATFVNLGYGDIHASNRFEYGLTSLAMVLGFLLTTVMFIGSLSSRSLEQSTRLNNYRRNIAAIKSRLKSAGFSPEEVAKQLLFFEMIWYKNFLCIIESKEALRILPVSMQKEICFAVNIRFFKKSFLLQEIGVSHLRTVSLIMRSEFYHPGDIIFHRGTIKEKLILVKFGEIDIISEEDDESAILTFSARTCVGESSLVIVWPAKTIIRARTFTQLQVLHHADFNRILADYPDKIHKLRKCVQERIEMAREKRNRREMVEYEVALSLVPTSSPPEIKIIKQKLEWKERKQKANQKVISESDKFLGLYETETPRASSFDRFAKSTLPVVCMGKFPWILVPGSTLTEMWQYCVVVFTAVITFLYPHFIAFSDISYHDLQTFHTIASAVYILDIYVLCTTAVEEKGELISKVKCIIDHHLSTFTFYLDILAALPTHYFHYFIANDPKGKYAALLSINKLLKCWKIIQFLNQKENDLWANVEIWKIIKYLVFLLIMAYWSATALYMAATFRGSSAHSWYTVLAKAEVKNQIPDPLFKHPELLSFYFSINTLCGVGLGNVSPANFTELGMVMVIILLGVLLLGYYMAEFSTAFYFRGSVRAMYQEKFLSTIQFMKEKHIDPEIVQRAMNFLSLQWEYNKGSSITRELSMFPTMSDKHQERILLKEMVETLQKAPIFQLTDTNMLMLVAKAGQVLVLPPGEYIHRAGTWLTTLYILQEGYCKEFNQFDEDTGRILGPVTQIGTLAMFYSVKSIRSIQTITDCKLIIIKRKDFTRITSIFPLIWETNNEITKKFSDRVTKLFDAQMHGLHRRIKPVQPTSAFKLEARNIHKRISQSFKSSFQKTKAEAQNYWKPFQNMGIFRLLGRFFMPWSILPTSHFLKAWCTARAITVCGIAFYLPIDKAIDMAGAEEKWWMYIVDIFAVADIYLMFHVAYYNKKGILVTHPYYTGVKYLKSNFIIDLFACFPFELLVKERHGSLRQLLRMNRILQAYRLIGAFKYLGNNIFKSQQLLHLIKYIPGIIVFINITTTIFVKINCDVISNGIVMCKKGSFIQRFNSQNSTDAMLIYAIGYYWVSSTLFGYGLVNARSGNELPLTTVLIVIGFLLFGFICAIVSSYKLQKNTDLILYKDKLNELRTFMIQESVPGSLKMRVMSYFEYKLFRTTGHEINEMFSFFNRALREDAYLSHYQKTFLKATILCTPHHDFVRHIGGQIREHFLMADETIIQANYIDENVYIISRGNVILTDKSNKHLTQLGPGDMFGNLQSRNPVLSDVTATCDTDVDVLLIESDIFQENLEFYPGLKEGIQSQLKETQEFIKQTTEIRTQNEAYEDMLYMHSLTLPPKMYISVSLTSRPPGNMFERWWREIITPHSTIITVLDIAMLVCSYISCWKVTYQFAFQFDWPAYHHVLSLMDLLYFINIYAESRKAYVNKYGKIISDYSLISLRYTHSKRFIFDIMINIPYYLVAFILVDKRVLVYTTLQLVHLLRMYYILKFYKDRRRAATSAVNASAIFIWTSLFVHFCACFLYMLACPLRKCFPNSWIMKADLLFEYSATREYFVSLYLVLEILTGTCYGYIRPLSRLEMATFTIMLILAKFAVCMLIAEVTDLFCSGDRVLKVYERNMYTMQDMLKNQHASSYQRTKVWKYTYKLWKYEHGVQKPSFLKQMPLQLKIELLWAIYGHHLENAFIFRSLKKCFLQQLVIHLNHTVYFANNYIVHSGDVDLSMHFVHRGEVSVVTVHKNHLETVHDILKPGQMFGVAQGLYCGMPHCFSYRAQTNTDVLSLHLDSWSYLFHYYPSLQKDIYERISGLRKNSDPD